MRTRTTLHRYSTWHSSRASPPPGGRSSHQSPITLGALLASRSDARACDGETSTTPEPVELEVALVNWCVCSLSAYNASSDRDFSDNHDGIMVVLFCTFRSSGSANLVCLLSEAPLRNGRRHPAFPTEAPSIRSAMAPSPVIIRAIAQAHVVCLSAIPSLTQTASPRRQKHGAQYQKITMAPCPAISHTSLQQDGACSRADVFRLLEWLWESLRCDAGSVCSVRQRSSTSPVAYSDSLDGIRALPGFSLKSAGCLPRSSARTESARLRSKGR